jgi:ubiquinone/menaquinone biosynthesis C-methylase UbiE
MEFNMDMLFEIHSGNPREGPGSAASTRKAFEMLPKLDKPSILDIGCGPGAQTLDLAALTNGHITAIDFNQPYLDVLQQRAKKAGMSNRITIHNMDMNALDIGGQQFDIIWAEGSIFILGLEKGLREFRNHLKPGGYLAASDIAWFRDDPPSELKALWLDYYPTMTNVEGNMQRARDCGYNIIGHFPLPESDWLEEYYAFIEPNLVELRGKYAGNEEALAYLDMEQQEIDMYRQHSQYYGYEFYVMQRRD